MLKPFSYIKDLCNTEPDENHNNNSDPDEETGGLLDDTYSNQSIPNIPKSQEKYSVNRDV